MLKKLLIGLAILAGLAGPVHGAGTVPGFSLTPQFDATGTIAPGCKLYTQVAGTTSTPQTVYQDSALTISLPYPVLCDSSGRLPQWFAADGQIKLRLTTASGTQVFVGDNLLVIGASSGGGGGSPVDPTTIIATGDLKARYGTGVLTGFVRANGRTIGSATSGATERANSDTQALFEYLWDADANLTVSTGRGANAAADWTANKTIALPDWRGRAMAFLDDMGNSAAGRLTTTYFGTSPIVLGAASTFLESRTITTPNLPAYTPAGSISNGAITFPNVAFATDAVGGDAAIALGPLTSGTNLTAVLNPAQAATTFTGTAQGGTSTPFSVIPPTMLATIYVKL